MTLGNEPRRVHRRCRNVCTATVQGNVILGVIVMVYLCLGAFVFYQLELSHEQLSKEMILRRNAEIINGLGSALNLTDDDLNWKAIVEKYLREYEIMILKASDAGITRTGTKWTAASAFVMSLTIVSTIGYGHITPVTWEGRLFCTFYAIFGIPLFLLLLSTCGNVLAERVEKASRKIRRTAHRFTYKQRTKRRSQCHFAAHGEHHNGQSCETTHHTIQSHENTQDDIRTCDDLRNTSQSCDGIDHATNQSLERLHHNSQCCVDFGCSRSNIDLSAMGYDNKAMVFNKHENTDNDHFRTSGTNYCSNYNNVGEQNNTTTHESLENEPNMQEMQTSETGRHVWLKNDAKTDTQLNEKGTQTQRDETITREPKHRKTMTQETQRHEMITRETERDEMTTQEAQQDETSVQESPGHVGSLAEFRRPDENKISVHNPPTVCNDVHTKEANGNPTRYARRISFNQKFHEMPARQKALGLLIFMFLLYMAICTVVTYFIEDDWNFVDSLYFWVVTFTTIGFGDLTLSRKAVDGDNATNYSNLRAFCIACVIISGLILLSACFSLAQEKMKTCAKDAIRRLGRSHRMQRHHEWS
uniref:Uncharacterized protein LOC102805727 n=1 Tax=Saccoglossus kowalevskii TaxID=10224 RepID=A0ABM0M850_SACKO|nr:PREDICTED: uncharacterized protein LOC102805727 [Saccoglossus kowalevskii]